MWEKMHPRDRSDSKETHPEVEQITNTVSKRSPARVADKLLAKSQRKAPEGRMPGSGQRIQNQIRNRDKNKGRELTYLQATRSRVQMQTVSSSKWLWNLSHK